jgi:uncharacterized protein (DUF1330 family)
MVVIEFPNRDSFEAWYSDPEYQEWKQLRLSKSYCTTVLAEGYVPEKANFVS